MLIVFHPIGKYVRVNHTIHALCLSKGVSILRVHDVKEAVECVKLINFAKNQL